MKITSKLLLQVVVSVLGVIPLIAGGRELLFGPCHINMVDGKCLEFTNSLDSEFRFLAGLWLTMGGVIYYMVPRIDKVKVMFTAVGLAIFMGGVGRVISFFEVGPPDHEIEVVSFLEIIVVPILIVWQHMVVKKAEAS